MTYFYRFCTTNGAGDGVDGFRLAERERDQEVDAGPAADNVDIHVLAGLVHGRPAERARRGSGRKERQEADQNRVQS